MIKANMLDEFGDEDVQDVRALCDKVLKARDDARKAKAMESARATLAAAGISLKDLNGKAKGRPPKIVKARRGKVTGAAA